MFPDINKLCNVTSCWIYIGILLGAHPFLYISRIRVKVMLRHGRRKIYLMKKPFSEVFHCVIL
jgi:hypothetical protein